MFRDVAEAIENADDTTSAEGALTEAHAFELYGNAKLPRVDGAGERQIDVLLTLTAAGYLTAWWIIECKNYKREIKLEDIDKFVRVLNDVGVPIQCSIYACAGGYSGAVRRALADEEPSQGYQLYFL